NLQDVHRTAFGYLPTRGAGGFVNHRARNRRRLGVFMTVEGAREQTRGRGLAPSAGTGKEIGVLQTFVLDRVLQRAGQNFLARYVFEFLWAPLTGDYLVRHFRI